MRKIKLLKTKGVVKYTPISVLNFTYESDTAEVHSEGFFPKTGGEVYFVRNDGHFISINEEETITRVDSNTFTFPFPEWKEVYPVSSAITNGYALIEFSDNLPAATNRDEIETLHFLNDIADLANICSGEYVFINKFLYKAPSTEILNTPILIMVDDEIFEGYIPVRGNASDNRKYGIFSIEDAEEIMLKCRYMEVLAKDVRFFENGAFKPGTTICKREGDLKVSLPFGLDFSTEVHKEDIFGREFVNKTLEEKVNKIIDYEKVPFTFAIKNGEETEIARELVFNLRFRDRGENNSEWINNNDDTYWVAYEKKSGDSTLTRVEGVSTQADDLYYLNFTDDDVLMEKAALAQSFIRISFYDTTDKNTQSILCYSTIFFDTNDLRNRALKQKEIIAQFSCGNKLTSEKASEGFYLYLFPNTVYKTLETTIYMKVEFNHAKYGYTIPMTMPTEEGTIIKATDSQFPINYKKVYSGENYYVDMDGVREDMYIPVNVKYDSDKNLYVWYFPIDGLNNEDGKITLELFEPRINGKITEKPIATVAQN